MSSGEKCLPERPVRTVQRPGQPYERAGGSVIITSWLLSSSPMSFSSSPSPSSSSSGRSSLVHSAHNSRWLEGEKHLPSRPEVLGSKATDKVQDHNYHSLILSNHHPLISDIYQTCISNNLQALNLKATLEPYAISIIQWSSFSGTWSATPLPTFLPWWILFLT